jgi:hypothetical protein
MSIVVNIVLKFLVNTMMSIILSFMFNTMMSIVVKFLVNTLMNIVVIPCHMFKSFLLIVGMVVQFPNHLELPCQPLRILDQPTEPPANLSEYLINQRNRLPTSQDTSSTQ